MNKGTITFEAYDQLIHSLKGGRSLRYKDIVIIAGCTYGIDRINLGDLPSGSFHYFLSFRSPDHLFKKLGLNRDDFCKKAFGYKDQKYINMPVTKVDDMEALTRLVLKLFKHAESTTGEKAIKAFKEKERREKARELRRAERRRNKFKKQEESRVVLLGSKTIPAVAIDCDGIILFGFRFSKRKFFPIWKKIGEQLYDYDVET